LRTKIKSSPGHNKTSAPCFRIPNTEIVKSLKAGFLAFSAILLIIFFINLISFFIGSNEKFGMDSLDFLLAGTGFVLQMTGTLVKSFIR